MINLKKKYLVLIYLYLSFYSLLNLIQKLNHKTFFQKFLHFTEKGFHEYS
jgi:hypothetical protein